MKNKTLHLLTLAGKLLAVLVGFAAYADWIPGKYKAIAVAIFAIASILKEAVKGIGDILDDGIANNSFKVGSLAAFLALGTMLGVSGCAVISHFDQNSYESAQSLKARALALVARGAEPATKYAQEIASLKSALDAAIAYEKGKGNNNLATQAQWKLLCSPDRNLLGGFLKQWQGGKTFSPAFLDEESQLIGQAFDELIRLESAKPK